ncbi:transcriptional regulator family: GATA type zinc finger [Aspergillus niger]|uniref:GATA-type domain-containing protein n=2 Tax=Aspergillus TaxID=5052 RepID=A0A370PNN4_ASPPH|nr:transcriptional regulator family: GATA type zinc finger [Aspergillus niger]RDK43798.1 hypothetical protein M752DRAFT_145298 [Aspergillus phoenicis ATCC 13157]KAI2894953.1 transcriptional regulator family: GATA type zinc finger [Aspergillus niger]KAI2910765.1 transcriptional regulator family: GATA type zinc finger [Aspergillus niger]KAI2950782.1 transcriptional regulator family: GATA type zinc finger [Aspergillus niger]
MGSLEAEHRHREHLPALGYLGKDGPSYAPKHPGIATAHTSSPTPLLSPTTMYPGQPLPVSYTTSTGSGHLQAGYISPPDSRRALEEEKDKQQQQPQRQSLPSIHEALGNDNHLPYPAPTPAPQQAHHAPPHSLPPNIVGRPATEGPPGPPNPFSSGAATGPFVREPAFQHQLQAEASRSSLTSINTQDSRNASLQSLNSGKSPTQSAKTGITSISGSQVGSGYEYSAPPSAGSVASPNGYGAFSQSFSFQPQPPSNAPAYPSASYDARTYGGTSWKPGVPETARVDDVKPGLATRPAIAGQPQSDSVKRHLDIYDVETSLNEIAEMSTRTLDFSRHYAARAHHTQRSGPVLGSLPSIHEVEEMLNIQRRNQDALIRIRTAILNQEHAMAEQMAQRKAFKTGGVHDDVHHMAMYQEEYKGSGGFAGPDSKKRRGKAAPPGRCHSCNRAETPEWRRGPDGARTLCNACGLHYAKLTRKMGANKASSLGSNLKPKTALDSASPSSH